MNLIKREKSTQDLIGIKSFSKYGLNTNHGELIYFAVSPSNLSVLSKVNIDIKVRHLLIVLSTIPNIEVCCIDSCECFDQNKQHIKYRLSVENNPKVRKVLEQDIDHLDSIQIEMSTARQFIFLVRFKNDKDDQVFQQANRIEKTITEQGFESKRLKKSDIKRMLAIYFGASMQGEDMADYDGQQWLEMKVE